MLVPFDKLRDEFNRVLIDLDFTKEKAGQLAKIFAENSRDGVYTHGLNRFPRFVQFVKDGVVKPGELSTKENGFGAIERWNGNLGPGILNAQCCMERAMELAAENGIGCVALKNTNHWMRGGTYGWQAAEGGFIGICFTNTLANLPPWGGLDPRLGNNPLVIAVPREGGHVVLDMAISQYAVGKLHQYEANEQSLPLPGGYDDKGELSTDATAILSSKRLLPIGFWKGSGLSLILDLLVTVLSGGKSTAQISQSEQESGISQVFIAIKPTDHEQTNYLIEEIIAYTKTSRPIKAGDQISYPGENTLKTRMKNLKDGIPVDQKFWKEVLGM